MAEGGEVAVGGGSGVESLLLLAGSTVVVVVVTLLAASLVESALTRARVGALTAGTTAVLTLTELRLLTNDLRQRNEVLLLLRSSLSRGRRGRGSRSGSLSLGLVPVVLDGADLSRGGSEGGVELLLLLGLLGLEGSERESLGLETAMTNHRTKKTGREHHKTERTGPESWK